MKFKNIRVYNFENAIHGMRNPLASWDKSDTIAGICKVTDFDILAKQHLQKWGQTDITEEDIIRALQDLIIYNDGFSAEYVSIGPEDMKLMKKLIAGGTEHRKFMRQIFITVDITAPLYVWKEFDTYKVGTVANSTSTMHTLTKEPITRACFEFDDYHHYLKVYDREPYNEDYLMDDIWDDIINACETLRRRFLETNDSRYWKELIRILPESWLQTRTVTLNYENLLSIMQQRKNHKLNEWSGKERPDLPNFINFIKQLPYAKDLLLN